MKAVNMIQTQCFHCLILNFVWIIKDLNGLYFSYLRKATTYHSKKSLIFSSSFKLVSVWP